MKDLDMLLVHKFDMSTEARKNLKCFLPPYKPPRWSFCPVFGKTSSSF